MIAVEISRDCLLHARWFSWCGRFKVWKGISKVSPTWKIVRLEMEYPCFCFLRDEKRWRVFFPCSCTIRATSFKDRRTRVCFFKYIRARDLIYADARSSFHPTKRSPWLLINPIAHTWPPRRRTTRSTRFTSAHIHIDIRRPSRCNATWKSKGFDYIWIVFRANIILLIIRYLVYLRKIKEGEVDIFRYFFEYV